MPSMKAVTVPPSVVATRKAEPHPSRYHLFRVDAVQP
jgi:hypothetical protein